MDPMDPRSARVLEIFMILANNVERELLNELLGLEPPTEEPEVWIKIKWSEDGLEERLEGSRSSWMRQLKVLDPNDKVWIVCGKDGTKWQLNGDDLIDLESALGHERN